MARVRVGDEDVHALFRPGGSVEDIDRTDRSGRTRFNLETGLQFANQAMRSPALGVGANLLGRGLTALGRSIRDDGTTDMGALRQQAAARLAGATPDMTAGRMAIGEARTEQAGRDAQAQQILGQPADPLDSVRFGQSLSGQQRPLSLGDVNSSGLATQNPYEFGSSPNMQYLPEGAAPFSTGLEQAARAQQEQGQPERPPLPEVDYHRPFISDDDIKRHTELRKHLASAASPAEAIKIAHEMQAHQDKMTGRPQGMIGQQMAAPQAVQSTDRAEPQVIEPQIVMAQTPAGEVPVVKLDDRTLAMRDPESGGMLHVEMVNGRPVVKQRFTAEEMMQLAQQQQPAPEAPAAAPLSQMASRERAAEMLRSGLGRPAPGTAPAPAEAPALDEFGRTPERAAKDKRRAAELVHAPMASRGPVDREQLLAQAATARTPEQQAEILRQVPDVDVWGTTLEDILTGSHQAKGQYLRQLHEAMPASHMTKTPEELAHIMAQTATEKAREKMYSAKPGEADRRATLAESKAAEAISKNLDMARANEHRIVATEARTKSQREIADVKADATLAKLAEMQKEFDAKLKAGAFKKGGVTINVGDRVKMANSLRDAGEYEVNRADEKVKAAEKTWHEYGHLAKMPESAFDKEYPGLPERERPADYVPSDAAGDYTASTREKHIKEVKAEQDRWDAEKKHLADKREEALTRRKQAMTAKDVMESPELQQIKAKGQSLVDQGVDYIKSKLGSK